ncbi:hypothetical protein [Prosthecobacter dejongeii]|uniref:Flagellar hook-basal body complex protein FliE n=1 Tax=Prosthecobacter dejongeii TaxID=48465 RepID=A0A7W7YJH4_9BACT|nr:hypothetical protein [Prosthecobacter dejongeii]MBB5037333.1 flagellar hook-basal body complex protein FliE [Prosthecobacter dejongeii]
MDEHAARLIHWQQQAKLTARKVNLGWFLACLTPSLIMGGILGFIAILWWRTQDQNEVPLLSGLLLALALALFTAFWRARAHFITPTQALIRLESHLHLHNALSVAQAGHGPWPAIQAAPTDGWKWHWFHITTPWLSSAACLALAFWMPLSHEVLPSLPAMQPQAWQQMDEWLQKLEEEKLITPEEKEEQAAKVTNLRDQPPDQWFSHDSLHATDTLKEQLQRDLAEIAQNLKTAERSLNALQNHADKLSQAGKEQLLKDLDEAVKGLQSSALELNPALLKELAQMDPKNIPSLSKNQLDQLRETLKKGAKESQGLSQNPGFLGDGEGEDDELAEMLNQFKQSPGTGEGEGESPGAGDVSRGPGTAPLTLANEENDFGTEKNEAVSNSDLSRAQLSSVLGIKDGKHEVDKTYAGPIAAGQAQHQGLGGEQVWRETLTPEEKAVLKRVFK